MSAVADVPPNDLDAEAAVLSAILCDGEKRALAEVSPILAVGDFYAHSNATIYRAILELASAGQPIDIVTVSAHLRGHGRLESVGGNSYLAQISDATPAIVNVAAHARLVRTAARKRAAVDLGRRIATEAANGIEDFDAWVRDSSRQLAELEQPMAGLAPLDAAGIFAPLRPVNYIVRALDLCPGAPAMCAGYGWSGKTIAAQDAALTIAAVLDTVWDCFRAARGRVLHIDYEQGSRLTRERYQRLAFARGLGPSDLGDRLALLTMPGFFLDQAGAEAELSRLVAGYQLVIIDSLRAAAPTLDENSSEVRRVLDMLSRVSERTGVTFLVIHHARKPQRDAPGGAKMAIRGSGALFDACGSVLIFEGEKGQPTLVSHEKARASGVLTDDFEIEITDVPNGGDPRAGVLVTARAAQSREDAAEDAARERRLTRAAKLQEEIRALFRREPEQAGADSIAGKLGRKTSDVRSALRVLGDTGEVLVTGSTRDRRHSWSGRE